MSRNESTKPVEFENSTYFILPLSVEEPEKLDAFLGSREDWAEEPVPFKTQYILYYAGDMNRQDDKRLRSFRYTEGKNLNIYMMDEEVQEDSSFSEEKPVLGEIRLYLFGCGIAFLEFQVQYGKMAYWNIVKFVNLFRSLRNNETSDKKVQIPEGKISLEKAAEKILPENESGTLRCFSNPSKIKRQADIFTVLNAKTCILIKKEDAEFERIRFLLAHGYNNVIEDKEESAAYEMKWNLKNKTEFWGGSQDGLAFLVKEPQPYQYDHLSNDYHFMYLLLLNQRYSAMRCIGEVSQSIEDYGHIRELCRKVTDIKARYSFRVVSDEHFMQNFYSKMYEVLNIDKLLQDIEDVNTQLSTILGEEQKQKEEKQQKEFDNAVTLFGTIFTAVSVISIASACIDLHDFLKSFSDNWVLSAIVIVIVGAAVAGSVQYARRWFEKHLNKTPS